MEFLEGYIMTVIEMGGFLAPLLFICFHLIRPLLFLPVVFICITGGVIFGPIAGSIYSMIGITLSSLLFYGIIQKMPNQFQRLIRLKQKIFGSHGELTTTQIAILRLVPFIHFHLLSLCLLEIHQNFKDYTRISILSNIPIAVIYTALGGTFSQLSPISIFTLLSFILMVIYLLRRKEIIIKWNDFFPPSKHVIE